MVFFVLALFILMMFTFSPAPLILVGLLLVGCGVLLSAAVPGWYFESLALLKNLAHSGNQQGTAPTISGIYRQCRSYKP